MKGSKGLDSTSRDSPSEVIEDVEDVGPWREVEMVDYEQFFKYLDHGGSMCSGT